MKKLIISAFIIIFSFTLSKTVTVAGMSQLLKTATKIAATQTQMDLKMVEDAIKQTQALENQYEMLQYEIKNLKSLGEEISDGNINRINNFLKKIENTKENSMSMLNNQDKLVNKYREIYKANPEAFENITGYNKESLDAIKSQVTKAKDETNYMLYEAVTQAGYSAKLNYDTHNINSLLQASKSSKGALEVLQVTNNILGAQSVTLLEIRQLLETSVKLMASIESSKSTTNSASERTLDEIMANMEETSQKQIGEIEKKMNKNIKFGN